MDKGTLCFDKSMTNIIKGIGLILMMCLHCYNVGYYYGATLDWHLSLDKLGIGFNLCIGIFAFMVGYGYAFSKTKDWKYGLKHIWKMLLPYYVILFLFTVPFALDEIRERGVGNFLCNLVGLEGNLNYFNWFIYYYIYLMILLPWVSKAIAKHSIRNALIICVVSYAVEALVHRYLAGMMGECAHKAVYNCLRYTPVAVLGLLFAQEKYYERLSIGKHPAWLVAVLSVLAIVIVLLLTGKLLLIVGFQLDFFYVPVFIGAVVILFNKCNLGPLRRLLKKIGDISVYMWFFHALFFTACVSWFYQPAITIFKDINLVVLWTMLITFVSSWLIKTIVDRITLALTNSNGR